MLRDSLSHMGQKSQEVWGLPLTICIPILRAANRGLSRLYVAQAVDMMALESSTRSLGEGMHTNVICPKLLAVTSRRTTPLHHNLGDASSTASSCRRLTKIKDHYLGSGSYPATYLQAVTFNSSQSILGPINFLPLAHQKHNISINSPNKMTGV